MFSMFDNERLDFEAMEEDAVPPRISKSFFNMILFNHELTFVFFKIKLSSLDLIAWGKLINQMTLSIPKDLLEVENLILFLEVVTQLICSMMTRR